MKTALIFIRFLQNDFKIFIKSFKNPLQIFRLNAFRSVFVLVKNLHVCVTYHAEIRGLSTWALVAGKLHDL